MDVMQIKLALGMDALGIETTRKNYREVCDATFLANERGIFLTYSNLSYNAKGNYVYSIRSHEYSGCLSTSFLDDVEAVEDERVSGCDFSEGFVLDEASIDRLKKLKDDINERGLKTLLREGPMRTSTKVDVESQN